MPRWTPASDDWVAAAARARRFSPPRPNTPLLRPRRRRRRRQPRRADGLADASAGRAPASAARVESRTRGRSGSGRRATSRARERDGVECAREVGACSVSRGGGSFRCAKTTASSLSRSNGRSPARHSNRTQPSAYTSTRPSTAARICSGGDVVDRADEAAVAGEAADRRDVPREAEVADVGTCAGPRRRGCCRASRHDGRGRQLCAASSASPTCREPERARGSSRLRRRSSRRSEPST